MLEMRWITAILQLYNQVTALLGAYKYDFFILLERCHCILNPRILNFALKLTCVEIASV